MAAQRTSWERFTHGELSRSLSTDLKKGLSPRDVASRQELHGKNLLKKARQRGIVDKIIKQFKNPLVIILLLAGIATLLLREFVDATVIFIALFINVAVGTAQEERASRAFEKLNQSQERFATVLRAGRKIVVPAEELVPGDVVEIKAGSHIPADMRLLSSKDLQVNEAVLTGEWASVEKHAAKLEKRRPLAEQVNMAWMGTLVVTGYGVGVVIATGSRTEVGKIADALGRIDESMTPLQQSIRRVARFLLYIIAIAIIAILALGFFRGEPFGDMLLVAIALAVATMPEGLPAAVTIVLALGMESILKRGGLVRNLLAAETLGATTFILTDKTGTLTQAKMHLSSLYTLESIQQEGREGYTKDDRELLRSAVLASDAFVEEDGTKEENAPGRIIVHGRPIEQAIVLAGLDAGISQHELSLVCPRIDFLQFSSARRFGVSLNKEKESKEVKLFLSGAPEMLLDLAQSVYLEGKEQALSDEHKKAFLEVQARRSAEGMRFIGVAYKHVNWKEIPERAEEGETKLLTEDIIFLGFMSFEDPIRDDVPNAIKEVQEAGARVVMVTGDNPETAFKIACEVGIDCDRSDVYLGKDLEGLSDKELYDLLTEAHVFARTLPQQKLRIARVLKGHGEVVAMTGDGINDAPALQSANIGVAVGSGTEVAKEASDMILINNSFAIIVAAIKEGRKIIENLKKIIAYLLSTSFSEIFVIGAALLAGAPLPLLPGQILWANIVGEGLMSFPLAFEKADSNVMKHNPRSHLAKNIITKRLKELIFVVGGVTGAILIALYFYLLSLGLPIEKIRTLVFVALSIGAMFFVFSLKSLDTPLWKIDIFDNKFLLGALGVSFLLLIGALAFEPLRFLLSLTPLTAVEVLMLAGVGLLNLLTIEIAKYFFFERRKAQTV